MHKILREEMEYLITYDDKAITPDVKDDVRMTLDYIDELEKENEKLKKDKGRVVSERKDLLSSCLYQNKIIEEIKEYCEEIEYRSIDYADTDYDLGQYSVARDILRKIRGEDNGKV